MNYNDSYIARLVITVLETGDKQTGFSRKGINSKASKGTPDTLRGFFTFKDIWVSLTVERHRSNERGTTPKATETILISEKMEASVQIRNPYLIKISGSNRFYPDCLKRYIENVNKKQALLAPATCYHDKWLKQRIMAKLHHVSSLVSFRRLTVERGNIMYLNALHGR